MTIATKPLGLQIQDEILDRLAAAHPESMTTAQLYDSIGIAPESLHISRALYQLRKDGRVTLGEPALLPKKSPQHTYCLTSSELTKRGLLTAPPAAATDAARLLAHLEQELAPVEPLESAWPDALETRPDPAFPDPIEHLDHAAHSHGGDECDHAPEQAEAWRALCQDPVILALQRMPELPRLQEGRMHADRLGAVASRLESGLPILPDPDVIAWMRDLHTLHLELSA